MEKYELSPAWINKNRAKIKKGYSIALVNKYDITDLEDVLEILKIIDPISASKENAEVFSNILSLFEKELGAALKLKRKVKSKLVN